MCWIIKNGRVIDPSRGIDAVSDLYVEGGVVVETLQDAGAARIIDASERWVVPGLIDVHVHLREPGGEHKETIETGLRAAAAGGFTGVLPMPNTVPANDNPELTEKMISRARELQGTRVYPVPAITVGRKGESCVDFEALLKAGAVAFSDDGSGVADDKVMGEALEAAAKLGVPLAQHSEDPSLSRDGVVHDGEPARELNLPGWPAEAEARMIARDIELVERVGGHLHVSHISTKEGVELVRAAKDRGLKVTAEVTPHHLLLTDDLIREGSTNAKVNPPLRPQEHVIACVKGLVDGTIDVVATDHAPHTEDDKAGGFVKAAFGMVGLETAVPLMLAFVHEGVLTPSRLIEAMSTTPARLFNLPGGTLEAGAPADLAIIDPNRPHTIDPTAFLSKGRNTPFAGWEVTGRSVLTMVGGQVAFELDS